MQISLKWSIFAYVASSLYHIFFPFTSENLDNMVKFEGGFIAFALAFFSYGQQFYLDVRNEVPEQIFPDWLRSIGSLYS